jgi:hypothetical protein
LLAEIIHKQTPNDARDAYLGELQLARLKPDQTAPIDLPVLESFDLRDLLAVFKECLRTDRLSTFSSERADLVGALQRRVCALAVFKGAQQFFNENRGNETLHSLLSYHKNAWSTYRTTNIETAARVLENLQAQPEEIKSAGQIVRSKGGFS